MHPTGGGLSLRRGVRDDVDGGGGQGQHLGHGGGPPEALLGAVEVQDGRTGGHGVHLLRPVPAEDPAFPRSHRKDLLSHVVRIIWPERINQQLSLRNY